MDDRPASGTTAGDTPDRGVTAVEGQAFDVLLSYNRRDAAAVERIARALTREGLSPWLDVWCVTPGGAWQDELAEGLRLSASCAVFVGPDDLGPWERMEVGVALDRAAQDRGYRVFPVLLPGLEPFDPNTLPLFLRVRTWVDFRDGVESPRALRDLIYAVKGVPIGSGPLVRAEGDASPYRGLQVFEEQHSELFFGRDGDVQRLLEQLKLSRFLAVLGASGSGKSSLVRAGLVASLRAGRLSGSERWRLLVLRPGSHPLTALAVQLVAIHDGRGMQRTLDELSSDPRTLHLAVSLAAANRSADEYVVVVLDQFEEAFTLCEDERERSALLHNLVYAATVPGGQTMVILTLRSDFYSQLARYPEMAQLAQSHQVLVGALDTDRLREVIEGPALRAGLQVEAGLSDTIVADVAQQPGALPLLEHALLETWSRRSGGMLTLEGYRASGGVQGALAERAENIYRGLAPEQQRIARALMLRLTQPGDGTEDTRRRGALSDLVTSRARQDAVETVVDKLSSARMLTVSGGGPAGEASIEISHEALIRGWPRLKGWIDDERAALRLQRRLTDAAGEWRSSGRDRSLLYRGRRLAEALEWRKSARPDLSDTERAFLAAGQRLKRTTRGVALTSLMLLLLALGWLAVPQMQQYLWRHEAASQGPMVAFPAGVALLGGSRPNAADRQRRLAVAAFSLDRHEVSNKQYRLCVEAERCLGPVEPANQRRSFEQLPSQLPVVNVTARQAAAFCRWLGRRLPSKAEWERAARGLRGRPWPWGETNPTRADVRSELGGRRPLPPVPVADRAFRRGANPEGVMHLVGNVREFTSTPARCKPDTYSCTRMWDGQRRAVAIATRGGGWDETPQPVSGADTEAVDPAAYLSDATGFRCAKST